MGEWHIYGWIFFHVFIGGMLLLDLGVFHRRPHAINFKEALGWSLVWVLFALGFSAGLYFVADRTSALTFLTGYVIEKALSVDNIFVFYVLFKSFKVPPQLQHKVLFWGVLGAIALRAFFIFAGVALINRFHWLIYVFGAFLILTGIRMAIGREKEGDEVPFQKWLGKIRVTDDESRSGKFFVFHDGRRHATSLFVALLAVEISDLIFAMDSIPAILAISSDAFIVYTSNIFAILGLRSLYFALAGMMDIFHYLKWGLAAVLVFVGVKMCLGDIYEVPVGMSLAVIGGIIGASVIASVMRNRRRASV